MDKASKAFLKAATRKKNRRKQVWPHTRKKAPVQTIQSVIVQLISHIRMDIILYGIEIQVQCKLIFDDCLSFLALHCEKALPFYKYGVYAITVRPSCI